MKSFKKFFESKKKVKEAIDYLRSKRLAPETIMDGDGGDSEKAFKTEIESWIKQMKNSKDVFADEIDAWEEIALYYKDAYKFFKAEKGS